MKNYQLALLALILWTSGIVGGRTWRQTTTDAWWKKHIEEVAFDCSKQGAGPAEHDPVLERHTQEQAYKIRVGDIILTGDKKRGFHWKVYDGTKWVLYAGKIR